MNRSGRVTPRMLIMMIKIMSLDEVSKNNKEWDKKKLLAAN